MTACSHSRTSLWRWPLLLLCASLLAACTSLPQHTQEEVSAAPIPETATEVMQPEATAPAPPPVVRPPPRIALALGGGAARGFAHIGVIKALEAQGITPGHHRRHQRRRGGGRAVCGRL